MQKNLIWLNSEVFVKEKKLLVTLCTSQLSLLLLVFSVTFNDMETIHNYQPP